MVKPPRLNILAPNKADHGAAMKAHALTRGRDTLRENYNAAFMIDEVLCVVHRVGMLKTIIAHRGQTAAVSIGEFQFLFCFDTTVFGWGHHGFVEGYYKQISGVDPMEGAWPIARGSTVDLNVLPDVTRFNPGSMLTYDPYGASYYDSFQRKGGFYTWYGVDGPVLSWDHRCLGGYNGYAVRDQSRHSGNRFFGQYTAYQWPYVAWGVNYLPSYETGAIYIDGEPAKSAPFEILALSIYDGYYYAISMSAELLRIRTTELPSQLWETVKSLDGSFSIEGSGKVSSSVVLRSASFSRSGNRFAGQALVRSGLNQYECYFTGDVTSNPSMPAIKLYPARTQIVEFVPQGTQLYDYLGNSFLTGLPMTFSKYAFIPFVDWQGDDLVLGVEEQVINTYSAVDASTTFEGGVGRSYFTRNGNRFDEHELHVRPRLVYYRNVAGATSETANYAPPNVASYIFDADVRHFGKEAVMRFDTWTDQEAGPYYATYYNGSGTTTEAMSFNGEWLGNGYNLRVHAKHGTTSALESWGRCGWTMIQEMMANHPTTTNEAAAHIKSRTAAIPAEVGVLNGVKLTEQAPVMSAEMSTYQFVPAGYGSSWYDILPRFKPPVVNACVALSADGELAVFSVAHFDEWKFYPYYDFDTSKDAYYGESRDKVYKKMKYQSVVSTPTGRTKNLQYLLGDSSLMEGWDGVEPVTGTVAIVGGSFVKRATR